MEDGGRMKTMTSLRQRVEGGGLFQGYAYGYPHKTAYRPLRPEVPLAEAWRAEDKNALFLYLHVPFCEMRCGFCNLFTTTGAGETVIHRYLDALERQGEVVRGALGDGVGVARIALGGGTPSVLGIAELERVWRVLKMFSDDTSGVPLAVEMSPQTSEADKLSWLREAGVKRASLGVQSFLDAETRALGRLQRREEVEAALQRMTDAGFPVRNVDLIYGIAGQTRATWIASLDAALAWQPEEIFLYPLYVRPLTGLERKGMRPADEREELYRAGRDHLLAHGYRQVSMRLFRAAHHEPGDQGVHYCCQEDGMVGLGAGARSYTRALHYSSEWAVGRGTVRAILEDYSARDARAFARADYGCHLDEAEQKRRYVIKSLLRIDGLDEDAYRARFGAEAMEDFPCLEELVEEGAARVEGSCVIPTALGLEWSDVIGPWLYSDAVQAGMREFELR
jgi:oxygen-independent coproporphyrinogen-3 oxidase